MTEQIQKTPSVSLNGNFRVMFVISDDEVIILRIGPRKDAYKR